MNELKTLKYLDINVSVPRSSRNTMAGIAHLPRMIDKARAYKNQTLGEYFYPCPLDKQILQYLAVSSVDFADLAEVHDDEQLTEWTKKVTSSRTKEERKIVNEQILNSEVDPEDMPSFLEARNQIDPTRTDITTWIDLNDLEEGHI